MGSRWSIPLHYQQSHQVSSLLVSREKADYEIIISFSFDRYALTGGDGGIVRTLDVPLYIASIRGSSLFCLNRDAVPLEVIIIISRRKFRELLTSPSLL